MNAKQRAAEAALQYIKSDTVIGLGTGSTADYFLIALADALKSGRLKGIRGVPTSDETERRSREMGIPILGLAESGELDVTIDGADEVSPNVDLIKGLGGALLREKLVAQNSRRVVIIADASKRVEKLGTKTAVPIEVARFAHEATKRFLISLSCTPVLRAKSDGSTFVTDNGNYIYDCHFVDGIAEPEKLNEKMLHRAGVLETGLFLGIASVALIADANSVQTLIRR